MAIINCPECDGKISSTVKQCIHCGAKVTVCPECEQVIAGEGGVCPKCGYAFIKRAQAPHQKKIQPNDESIKTAGEANERCLTERPLKKLFYSFPKHYSNIRVAISCVLIAFFVIAIAVSIIQFFYTQNSYYDSYYYSYYYSNYSSYSSTINTIKTHLIVISIILIVNVFLSEFSDILSYSDFSAWLRLKNINAMGLIERSLDFNFEKATSRQAFKEALAINFAIDAEIYNKDEEMINKKRAYSITRAVVGTLLIILLCVLLLTIIDHCLRNDTNIDVVLQAIIGATIITLLVFCVFSSVMTGEINYVRKKWIKKNLKENEAKYAENVEFPYKHIYRNKNS